MHKFKISNSSIISKDKLAFFYKKQIFFLLLATFVDDVNHYNRIYNGTIL